MKNFMVAVDPRRLIYTCGKLLIINRIPMNNSWNDNLTYEAVEIIH